MDRRVAVALLVLLPPLVLALLLPRAVGLPLGAHDVLERYVAYRATRGDSLMIGATDRAAYPDRFAPEWSARTLGGGYRFAVEVALDGTSAPAAPWATDDVAPESRPAGGVPLPYPPRSVWCVTLWARSPAPQLVFVALHQDIHTAAWLVHEPAANAAQRLAELGCR